MSDVFISYASADRERITPLVELFERHGWSVWWDRTIPLGKTFDEVIEAAIDEARCVIVVWSHASVASRWVKSEAAEGARRGVLVPVQLDPVKLPLEFRRIQTAQLVGWTGKENDPEVLNLVSSISEVLGERRSLSKQDTVPSIGSIAGNVDVGRPAPGAAGRRLVDWTIDAAIGAFLLIAGGTLVKGWIAERDIWLLVPTFWVPALLAMVLGVVLWRRLRGRSSSESKAL